MLPTSVPARLVDAGVNVLAGDAHSVTYRIDGRAVRAVLILADRVQSPTPVLRDAHRHPGRVLIACETVSENARSKLLADANVDLIVGSTGELVLSGKTFRAANAARVPHAATARSLRRRAAERVCVLTLGHVRQADLAAAVEISQQAISKMTDKNPLPDTPMTELARRNLLVKLASIPADSGVVETYWYGTDPIAEQVRSAMLLGAELTVRVLAGGEVAADVLRPWRVPTRGLIYAEELIDMSDFGLVEATTEEATMTVRVPADPTLWATATWWRQGNDSLQSDVLTVDPVVALQDLSADTDPGDDARQRLTDWIVRR